MLDRSNPAVPRRIVWLTPEQRHFIWSLVTPQIEQDDADTSSEEYRLLCSVIEELKSVSQRERISGRLVSNHVTGLMLPHDALPVRLADNEAEAILALGVSDRRIRRMLETGPRKQGRR